MIASNLWQGWEHPQLAHLNALQSPIYSGSISSDKSTSTWCKWHESNVTANSQRRKVGVSWWIVGTILSSRSTILLEMVVNCSLNITIWPWRKGRRLDQICERPFNSAIWSAPGHCSKTYTDYQALSWEGKLRCVCRISSLFPVRSRWLASFLQLFIRSGGSGTFSSVDLNSGNKALLWCKWVASHHAIAVLNSNFFCCP